VLLRAPLKKARLPGGDHEPHFKVNTPSIALECRGNEQHTAPTLKAHSVVVTVPGHVSLSTLSDNLLSKFPNSYANLKSNIYVNKLELTA
jgi:hypothetical protein